MPRLPRGPIRLPAVRALSVMHLCAARWRRVRHLKEAHRRNTRNAQLTNGLNRITLKLDINNSASGISKKFSNKSCPVGADIIMSKTKRSQNIISLQTGSWSKMHVDN